MNTFFKTFFVCLIAALGFLFYQYVSSDSYSGLKLSSNNPVFGIHDDHPLKAKENNETKQDTSKEIKNQTPEPIKQDNKKPVYYSKVYFYSNSGKLTLVKREFQNPVGLSKALNILLRGPVKKKKKNGYYSEIPPNVDLISVQNQNNKVIVNLSSNFGNGGGSQSIENRVKQLSKTVKLYAPNKSVYLYIDGTQVEYLGGDGVYIKQPLD